MSRTNAELDVIDNIYSDFRGFVEGWDWENAMAAIKIMAEYDEACAEIMVEELARERSSNHVLTTQFL